MEQFDVVDDVGKEAIFNERRALWRRQKTAHFRLRFAFNCDCSFRTTHPIEVAENGKISAKKDGDQLTVGVRDGKIIEVLKEDGKRATLKEFGISSFSPDLIEYQWNIGKSENDGVRRIADPIAFLWTQAEHAIHDKNKNRILIIYDQKTGIVKKIDFRSNIPDSNFSGEITDYTPLF